MAKTTLPTVLGVIFILLISSCSLMYSSLKISPVLRTEPVDNDPDDPAIWVNQSNPADSLVIGTDKGAGGSLYVFDLEGNSIESKRITGLDEPNNVDVEYGLPLGAENVDIAVATERGADMLRVYRLPEMTPIDGGGIPVFEGQSEREPMGIGLYKRPSDGAIYAVVSRKTGPSGSYLGQYRLKDDGTGTVIGEHVRYFGKFSGHEVEAVAVDDASGYVYYSDEVAGIRKYHADPDHENEQRELAFFGTDDFRRDMEGISIYATGEKTGYLIISDQQDDQMNIYRREGEDGDPHQHWLIKTVYVEALKNDGNEVTNVELLPSYPGGLFVAMSDDGTFHYYAWKQLAEAPGRQLDIKN